MHGLNRYSAVAACAVAVVAIALLPSVFAHEGHGKPAGATFDPNAPKRVSEATAAAIDLRTAEVDFGRVEDIVRLTGMAEARPDSIFAVAPSYAGVVRAIGVQPGDQVGKGDVLADIESPEVAKAIYDVQRLESEIERLLAEATRAETQVAVAEIEAPAAAQSAEIAESEVERLRAAGDSVAANLLAQRSADALKLRTEASLRTVAIKQARAEVESLRRQAAATKAAADALRGTLPRAKLAIDTSDPLPPGVIRFTSPIDGVVVSRNAVIGEGVAAGAPVLSVGNFSAVQIQGEVPEGLIARLGASVNAKVRVRRGVDGELLGEGTVRFLSPVIDASKRTAHIVVDVDNAAGALRPGQFVDLAVVLRENDSAVVVPVSAIVKEGPLEFVFVKEGKGESEAFKKRDVATGVRDDRVVEIRQGLVPGDVIAVGGAFSLSQLRGFVAGERATDASETKDDGHGHKR